MCSEAKPAARIQLLPPQLAQKIAAGEVIERPQSVVRELLDNAIDAGAANIELHLEEGGNARIVLTDDGMGMDRDNLAMAWLPHATSKIHAEADLYNIRTLGFRGEALSSIAAVSHLIISSCDGSSGGTVELKGGAQLRLDGYAGKRGTRVEVRNVFYNLPARKQFLKRPATEGSLCKNMLVEKALAHPEIAFRLSNETGLVLFLPACAGPQAPADRFYAVYPDVVRHRPWLHQIEARYPDGSARLVVGQPEMFQHDRRMVQVFVNRRRVNEYALVQAVEYGFTGYLPGGRYPVAALFLEVDPARLDVNIHPAKREVKFGDLQSIHSSITKALNYFLRMELQRGAPRAETPAALFDYGQAAPRAVPEAAPWPTVAAERPAAFDRIMAPPQGAPWPSANEPRRAVATPPSRTAVAAAAASFRYFGQIFGVFLLVETEGRLLVLDMHAAHERILYDRYRQEGASQELLLPLPLELGADQAAELAAAADRLGRLGIALAATASGLALAAVPARLAATPAEVKDCLEREGADLERVERRLFASLACRAAVMDGDRIDPASAEDLIAQALALPEQRCPHGRPIFFALSKAELFELVGRTV